MLKITNMRFSLYSFSLLTLILLVSIACKESSNADATNPNIDNNAKLMINYELIGKAIIRYQDRHSGNAPLRLEELIESGEIKEIPINPVTRLPMMDVSIDSQYKPGNYSYFTYPMRYRKKDDGPFICTTEYLLIIYHDGTYQSQCIDAFESKRLNAISSSILYTGGEVMGVHKKGIDTICPSDDEILDYQY